MSSQRSKYSTLCDPECTDAKPHSAPQNCLVPKPPRNTPTMVAGKGLADVHAVPIERIEQDAIDMVTESFYDTEETSSIIHRKAVTESGTAIMTELLPEWIDSFLQKNADYGDNAFELGAAGQFSDIWRKIGKLRSALWEGKELTGEQPEEILDDLIGHCFLTKLMLQEGKMK